MAVEEQRFYIAKCDTCGIKCDEAGDVWLWDTTRVAAIEQAAEAPGWTEVEGGIVCGISDRRHDEARGGDSPLVQRPTRDAVTSTFGDGEAA